MIPVGIEAMNVFGGTAFVDVEQLARHRSMDSARFQNLLMKQKAVALPCEDPITYAANAAKPLIDSLAPEERDRIELLITGSESGIDFGKSMSTYIHHYLGLNRNCRLFELKQACYAGTAGFQMACNFVLSQTSPGAKALVIATDISRFITGEGVDPRSAEWSYSELSAGAGAVAILVGEKPAVFEIDRGANGYYGYEVMDTCRPLPDSDAGNADLSLMSYLDCCEQAFLEYQRRVPGADWGQTFHFLSFHTPFGGMVKGAHRTMMRKLAKAPAAAIEADFERRVMPGLDYCQRVGNIMGGTIFLSLASTIDRAPIPAERRVGCFSYGSGCCSEFYSGVVSPEGQRRQRRFAIGRQLDARHALTIEEYEEVLRTSGVVRFGTRSAKLDERSIPGVQASYGGEQRLLLRQIDDYHRRYEWVA